MDKGEKQDKEQIEEYKKNPSINLADSINHSMVGNLGYLARGGCLTKIITIVTIAGGFLILSRCSN